VHRRVAQAQHEARVEVFERRHKQVEQALCEHPEVGLVSRQLLVLLLILVDLLLHARPQRRDLVLELGAQHS